MATLEARESQLTAELSAAVAAGAAGRDAGQGLIQSLESREAYCRALQQENKDLREKVSVAQSAAAAAAGGATAAEERVRHARAETSRVRQALVEVEAALAAARSEAAEATARHDKAVLANKEARERTRKAEGAARVNAKVAEEAERKYKVALKKCETLTRRMSALQRQLQEDSAQHRETLRAAGVERQRLEKEADELREQLTQVEGYMEGGASGSGSGTPKNHLGQLEQELAETRCQLAQALQDKQEMQDFLEDQGLMAPQSQSGGSRLLAGDSVFGEILDGDDDDDDDEKVKADGSFSVTPITMRGGNGMKFRKQGLQYSASSGGSGSGMEMSPSAFAYAQSPYEGGQQQQQ